MNTSTKKWLFLKYSSALLIPMMLWFIINLAAIYDSEYNEIIKFFLIQPSKILIFFFFFSSLTISEIFEDYINDEKIKKNANKGIYAFAIIMPLITIISIFNLNL